MRVLEAGHGLSVPLMILVDVGRCCSVLRVYLADSVELANVLRKEVLCLVKRGKGALCRLVHILFTFFIGSRIPVNVHGFIF